MPPGAGGCPRHRRRVARAVRAARPARHHDHGRAAHVHRPGSGRRAAQAPPRRRPARTVRASTCSATAQGRALYIGTSRNVRTRVRSYFTASELRTRMAEMVGIAERIDAVPCAHSLEAEVRELRLIAEHKPRYNRRSRLPERVGVAQAHGRAVSRDCRRYGWYATTAPPISARSVPAALAELAAIALHEAFPLRQCGGRLAVSRATRCVRARRARPLRRSLHGRAEPRGLRRPRRGSRDGHHRRSRARWSPASEAADGRAGRRRSLRGAGRPPRSADRFRPRGGAPAAPRGTRRGRGDGGRRSRRRGRLGAVRHPPRTTGRLGVAHPRARPSALTLQLFWRRRRRSCPGPGRCRQRAPRRPSASLRWLERPRRPAGRERRPWVSPACGAAGQREWLVAAERAARRSRSASRERP